MTICFVHAVLIMLEFIEGARNVMQALLQLGWRHSAYRIGHDVVWYTSDVQMGEDFQGKLAFVVSSVPGGSISVCSSTRDESQM